MSFPVWLNRAEYPFAVRQIESLSVIDEGGGPPVVFSHGTPTWSFEWRHLILGLRDTHRCIAPDHLGFGLSARPHEADYSPEAHARRFSRLIDALELSRYSLVVHDFGGPIALDEAFNRPERIERLILSAALTAGLVFLTGRVVEAAPSKEQEAGPSSPPFWLLIGLYVIVVIALAVARGASVDADVEGGGVVRAAFSLVLLVIAIGPAWLVERWMRERQLPAALRSRLAALKGREKELARVVRRARWVVFLWRPLQAAATQLWPGLQQRVRWRRLQPKRG